MRFFANFFAYFALKPTTATAKIAKADAKLRKGLSFVPGPTIINARDISLVAVVGNRKRRGCVNEPRSGGR